MSNLQSSPKFPILNLYSIFLSSFNISPNKQLTKCAFADSGSDEIIVLDDIACLNHLRHTSDETFTTVVVLNEMGTWKPAAISGFISRSSEKLGPVSIILTEYLARNEDQNEDIFKDLRLYPEEKVKFNQILNSRGAEASLRYSAGRIAAHFALQGIGRSAGPILNDIHGAPIFPPKCSASISHKNNFALCGILDTRDMLSQTTIGVDIEQLGTGSDRLGERILTGHSVTPLTLTTSIR
jgi:hypothetical protein